MSIITLPANLRIGAGGGMGQVRFDTVSQSDSSGAQQVRLLAPPRWTMRLVQPANLTRADAAAWQAMALQLRGRVNVLAAWDHARPEPAGSARGVLVTSGTVAAGATSLVITGAKHKNLLTYPSALDNAAWTGSAVTVTADAVAAPGGAVAADKIVESAANSSHYLLRLITPAAGQTYTLSAYVRAGERSVLWLGLGFTGGGRVGFDLAAGAVLAGTLPVESGSMSSIGGGWYRCAVTVHATATTAGTVQIGLKDAATSAALISYVGDGSSGLYAWGAQLEVGALTDYAAAPTLRAGDWLQVGTGLGTSHYCMVTADAQATDAGVLTVAIEPPTRATFSDGTAVAWDKPLAYYRQQTDATTWSMAPGGLFGPLVTGLSLDLMETWQ